MPIRRAVSSQLCSIIEWTDNSPNTLVHKFPMNGRKIMLGSSLTVRESQVAIFVNNGRVADVFQPGMHRLSTSNLPFLTVMLGLKYGMKSPFQTDVYFVNTRQFTNQKWGTSNPITMRDPEFGVIRIRGFGTFSFRVDEALTLMKELFGTNSRFTTEDINGQLRSKIISGLSEVIASAQVSAIDISAKLSEFQKRVKDKLDADFKALGLRLVIFNIENISFPEEVERALDTRASMGVIGNKMDKFTQFQTAHAMREAANNPNGAAGMGAGMGAGMAMANMMQMQQMQMQQNMMNQQTQQAAAPVAAPAAKPAKPAAPAGKCTKCKAGLAAGARFCPECGTAAPADRFCADCGVKIVGKARFCSGCGKPQ